MRTRLVALLVVAALGAGGGVATAVLTGDDPTTAAADPLGLGIPMVDLECTGRPVLVVGYGDNAAALRTAVVNNPADEEVRYLDTRRSCDARWTPSTSTEEPAWVAYVGPGDRTDLCLARMREENHQGDNVTFLIAGSDQRAMCLCEVPASAAPVLAAGTRAAGSRGNRIWIGELQDMLMTIDTELRPDEEIRLTRGNRTRGVYDEVMADRINEVRRLAGRPQDGVLDADVWNRVTRTGCPLYDYS